MKKLLLSVIVGVLSLGSVLGSNLQEGNPKKKYKQTYILRLNEDRAIKTKLIGSLSHSLMYTASDMDSTYSVFIPVLYGGNLDYSEIEVQIRPKKKVQDKETIRIIRFDK